MHGMPQASQTAALPAKTRQAFVRATTAKCTSRIFVILRVTKSVRCTEFQLSLAARSLVWKRSAAKAMSQEKEQVD